MKLTQKTRRFLVYAITRFSSVFFNLIPRKLANFLGSWAGLAAWKLITKDQRLIFRHLSLCYNGSLTVREKVNIGQRFFINSGRNISDMVRFEKNYEREIHSLVEVEGLEHFDNAYKRGKGVFGITGHLGNFELLAVYLAKCGYRIGVVSRPLADNKLNEMLITYRQRLGIVNFYASESPIGVVKWLKSGGAVGVLIDTDSSRVKGDFFPFYHRMSKLPVGQTVIALRLGAALVPMACVRNGNHHYKVIIKPEIPINNTGNLEKDIYRVTESCSLEIENLIRKYPDQWIWMHNRWKSAPENRA
ncbi:MAG TPA: lysophospholipid acyltransferase family protein [candidate division Zixibacteria bacterium]|nr:lysophospholipid acyltransferase family protein [candidate division Zixibacteria bacterium]